MKPVDAISCKFRQQELRSVHWAFWVAEQSQAEISQMDGAGSDYDTVLAMLDA